MRDQNKKIFVAGQNGMVGSAITRKLKSYGYTSIIDAGRGTLDLSRQQRVLDFFKNNKIDEIYLAAGKVGGIYANNAYPANFIFENLMIETNIIQAAHETDVQKLLFLGSSCIYPKFASQPIKEEALLTGPLEPTNEPYAIAKIAGIKLCESYNRQYGRDYRSVMPTNLYGPHDNYHPENSHVIPGLIRRFHKAIISGDNEIVIWGSGNPMREFLHVDDMASACVHVMELEYGIYHQTSNPLLSHINIGTGIDCSIRELAETLATVTGFTGTLRFDCSMPDGSPRKLLDVSCLKNLGWQSSISLHDGLLHAYNWYCMNLESARR